jgi:two-component system NtrC family sensor kinase
MNAMQAIPKNGKIDIRTFIKNAQLFITIKDTGIGMNESVVSHIFEPFYTTKDVGQGTGLGLWISYDIIKLHHGNIEVVSQEGQGTEFIISLPLTQPTPRPSPTLLIGKQT